MLRRLTGIVVIILAAWFLILPGISSVRVILDPAVRSGAIPNIAWSLHESLTPRFGAWAREWVANGRGEQLPAHDISGTEWPLFVCCFYLWANATDAPYLGEEAILFCLTRTPPASDAIIPGQLSLLQNPEFIQICDGWLT